MLYEVVHTIRYDYSAQVELGPHTLRLIPRSDAAQKLISAGWDIRPIPTGYSRILDDNGNDVLEVRFSEHTLSLALRFHLKVETQRRNPFDFVPRDPSLSGALSSGSAILAPFRQGDELSPALASFCREIRDEAQGKTMDFLVILCRRVKDSFALEVREEGAARSPEETWSLKRGTCRDLTLFFMACCRHEGLAARFVSGYYDDDPHRSRRDLHAWADVYVEGGGWRGFDPTIGMAVADRHIVLAAALSPSHATPVEGAFFGPHIKSRLRYEVSLHSQLTPPPQLPEIR
jgi:transglutaminase-like putative cysteine protease